MILTRLSDRDKVLSPFAVFLLQRLFRKGGGCAPEIRLFVPNLYPGEASWSMWSLVSCLAFLSTLEPGVPAPPCLRAVRRERKSASAQLFNGMALPKANKSVLIVLCASVVMM